MADRIQNRRDTKARWQQYNPILLEGEMGIVTDDPNLYKIGDGVTNWNNLPYRGFNGTITSEITDEENTVPSNLAISSVFGKYLQIVPLGKNLIDKDNLLYNYLIVSGNFVSYSGGIMSNKLYLEDGKTYTVQGAVTSLGNIYIGYFDENDNFLGRTGYPATNDSTGYGTATFKFDSQKGKCAYARINLKGSTNAANFDADKVQLEEGSVATSVVPFTGKQKFVFNENNKDIYNLFSEYIRVIPTGKNFIDKDNLLYGWLIQDGKYVDTSNPNNIMSNKLYLEDGKTYTVQGAACYLGTTIYIGYFDENDNFLGRTGYTATNINNNYGQATFKFNKTYDNYCYIRVSLGVYAYTNFDADKVQLEEGSVATSVVPFTGEDKIILSSSNNKQEELEIKILCIGNSFTYDAFYYMPFYLKALVPNVKLTIAIAYLSGSVLADHLANLTNKAVDSSTPKNYEIYEKSINGEKWQRHNILQIDKILADEKWDIITLQQGSSWAFLDWDTYFSKYIYKIHKAIYDKLNHSVKLGWLLTHGARGNSAEENKNNWQKTAENSKKIMEETDTSVLFPYGTAVENLRTSSLKSLGDGSFQNLSYDNVHLQDGVGRMAASYNSTLVILELLGIQKRGIIGEQTVIDNTFINNNLVSKTNIGSGIIGYNSSNRYLTQSAAVLAFKNPYELIDLSKLE